MYSKYSVENWKHFQTLELILYNIYHAYYIFTFRKSFCFQNDAAQKLDFILVFQEYWVLMDSKIPLKPVVGALELLHFPLVLMNRLNKTESAAFLYCRFSLIPKDQFSQII